MCSEAELEEEAFTGRSGMSPLASLPPLHTARPVACLCQLHRAPQLTPDINKIIRGGDYADPHLSQLSVDAVKMWQNPEWDGCYHE